MQSPLNVYFAGELFSAKHLIGNAVLAEAIQDLSMGNYCCKLPQNLDKQYNTAHAIRDEDLKSILSADVGLFNYDGPELDSGTVVEYLFAKFADIPAVILRTDFRSSGDQETDHAWNLMTSFFPRTEVLLINSMTLYKSSLEVNASTMRSHGQLSGLSAQHMIRSIASQVIKALDRVMQIDPIMPKSMQETIYRWLALMPGFKENHGTITDTLLSQALERKMHANCC